VGVGGRAKGIEHIEDIKNDFAQAFEKI